MGFRCSLVLVLAACLATGAMAQCPNDNTLTGVAVTPPCPGSTTVPCVQGGQYALVNVVAGNTYTFSTCAATFDTQITLYNNSGGGSIGYNDDACGATGFQSTVTWTATFTGQLRAGGCVPLCQQYDLRSLGHRLLAPTCRRLCLYPHDVRQFQ
ncbi:MAG: hypothetical protein IPG10_19135 [Flavobacteriales bacterium]|nr:hypothetical protein [Flavobacteriales bacterium]